MIDERILSNDLVKYYEFNLNDIIKYARLSKKAYKVNLKDGNNFFLKESIPNALEKYHFLSTQGVNNVLYPISNISNKYVTRNDSHSFYLNNYYESFNVLDEIKTMKMINELNQLHNLTSIKKQLSPIHARPKFDEITNRLDFKFRVLEDYVRSIESRELYEYSMPILSNYQYFLNAKGELIKLQKRLISTIKNKESVNYVYVHNNPHLDHLLNIKGVYYLTSLENGMVGLSSLDLAKVYVENEKVDLDFKTIIKEHFKNENNLFEYDYFRFLVLFILIKKMNLTSSDYINSTYFTQVGSSIKRYFENFSDNQEEIN